MGSKEGSPPALLHAGRRGFRLFASLFARGRFRDFQLFESVDSPWVVLEV